MAITNITLDDAVPGTTQTILIAASGNIAITVIYLCNTDTITRTMDVYAVPGGGAAVIGNKIYDAISIPAGDTFTIDTEKLVLTTLDEIRVIPLEADTTTAVIATVSTLGI